MYMYIYIFVTSDALSQSVYRLLPRRQMHAENNNRNFK